MGWAFINNQRYRCTFCVEFAIVLFNLVLKKFIQLLLCPRQWHERFLFRWDKEVLVLLQSQKLAAFPQIFPASKPVHQMLLRFPCYFCFSRHSAFWGRTQISSLRDCLLWSKELNYQHLKCHGGKISQCCSYLLLTSRPSLIVQATNQSNFEEIIKLCVKCL